MLKRIVVLREEQRKRFFDELEDNTHSAYLLLYKNKIKECYINNTCYYQLTKNPNLRGDELYIFFKVNVTQQDLDWCSWVINESVFKDCFITKKAHEGLTLGFEINTKAERALMLVAIMMLRQPFENRRFSWSTFRKLGFSEYESLALAMNFSILFYIKQDYYLIRKCLHNSNHKPFLPGQRFSVYEGKHLISSEDCLYSGFNGETIESYSVDCCGCKKYGIDWKSTYPLKFQPQPSKQTEEQLISLGLSKKFL